LPYEKPRLQAVTLADEGGEPLKMLEERDRLYFSKSRESRESRESSWATKDIRPAAERLAVPTTAL